MNQQKLEEKDLGASPVLGLGKFAPKTTPVVPTIRSAFAFRPLTGRRAINIAVNDTSRIHRLESEGKVLYLCQAEFEAFANNLRGALELVRGVPLADFFVTYPTGKDWEYLVDNAVSKLSKCNKTALASEYHATLWALFCN